MWLITAGDRLLFGAKERVFQGDDKLNLENFGSEGDGLETDVINVTARKKK